MNVTGSFGAGIFTLHEVADGAADLLVPVQRHSNIKLNFASPADLHTLSFDSLNPGSRYKLFAEFPEESFPDPTSEEVVTKCYCSIFEGEDGDDTGRPDDAISFQKNGHVMFRFLDNSRCEDAYSFARLESNTTDAQPEVFTSDYYYFSAQECSKEPYNPGFQASDDLRLSNLVVGRLYEYQIRASARHPWRRSSPATILHTVRWQASLEGHVALDKSSGGLPVEGVAVDYRLEDFDGDVILVCEEPEEDGWCRTTTSPSGKFHIDVSVIHPSLNNDDDFPIRMRFSKKTGNISHQFLCNEGSLDCTGGESEKDQAMSYNSTVAFVRHLEFDVPIAVIDDTTVALTGRISVANTELQEDDSLGCPIFGAEVCLVDHSKRNQLKVPEPICVTTNGRGEYEVPAVIGTTVSPEVRYHDHTFVPRNEEHRDLFREGILIQPDEIYAGFDLEDTTTADLTVELAAGLCNHNLGFGDIRIQIQGCSWEGIIDTQAQYQKKHTIPAHLMKVKVDDIRGFADDKSRTDIVEALSPSQDTIIDLRDLQAADNNVSEFLPEGVDGGVQDAGIGNETTPEEQEQIEEDAVFKLVRFQYDGVDKLNVRFGQEVEGCGLPSVPDARYSYHVLNTLDFFQLRVFAHQDFGYDDIAICTKYPPDTTVAVQNSIGVVEGNPVDRAWLSLIESKPGNAQVVEFLKACSPNW